VSSSAASLGNLGVDAGASLWKVAQSTLEGWTTRTLEGGDVRGLHDALSGPSTPRIGVTGGGARRLLGALEGVLTREIGEFDAWVAGAAEVAALSGIELPATYLLVSVGTGTSIILMREGEGLRVGGTALGGGSLLGLGRLLLGTHAFDDLVELAGRGDRRRVDLLVGDLYDLGNAPLPPELTASHFAKLESVERADLAHALVGLVGQNLALLCALLARTPFCGAIGAAQLVGA
jgi:type II pantothenate kinase